MNVKADLRPVVLRKRNEFLAAAQNGKKWITQGLILQINTAPEAAAMRYGLTASGKIGPAVQRNRARRRLRSLAVDILPAHARIGYDYVIIARNTTCSRDFAALRQDMVTALKKLDVWHG
ncbi:MAG: ribonuclease P protein component [Bdellovibrionales bacterium]